MHVVNRSANRLRAVAQDADIDRRRHRRLDERQLGHDLVDGIDDVGAGLFVDDQEHGALAVGPGRLRGVLRTIDGLADVADTQRSIVSVGDDDVVPGLGLGQLIVGIDRERAVTAVDGAFGIVHGRDRERRANLLQR